MNSYKLILTFSVVFLSGALAAYNNFSDEKMVEKTLMNYAEGMSLLDFNKIKLATVGNSDLSVFEGPEPKPNYGWDDYQNNHLKNEFSIIKNLDYNISDTKIFISDELATATFNYKSEALLQSGDGPEVLVGTYGIGTAVLKLDDHNWKILHLHTSRQHIGEIK
ncbi:hypothetical protein ACJJID_08985 [Microbulbifer sp. CnH-101-G]|uniref:hypothetical protein n=1 Tax=Microbulbifer sp. CnH-101-G TaxID=3243393 RepID=UPI004039DBD1